MNNSVINVEAVTTDRIETALAVEKNVSLSVLRLDKIHPVISGNKLFKLHYYLEEAINSSHRHVVTFGGAYSNHLAATAFAGRMNGLRTTGIIRGERPHTLSHTLLFCIEQGMHLVFVTREDYREKEESPAITSILAGIGNYTLVPEGGFGEKGVAGAAMITRMVNGSNYSHICCGVGTATTLAGLLKGSSPGQSVLAFAALKNMHDIEARITSLSAEENLSRLTTILGFDFGGYAKKTGELIRFMNEFYDAHHIPLDFVYTAKMMFGVSELIRRDYFPAGSNILCIHTGGLQGNLSLPPGMLNF